MDVKTGSKLLRKIQHTQSDYFNRKIHTFLDVVRAMESKYLLKDPKLLQSDCVAAAIELKSSLLRVS